MGFLICATKKSKAKILLKGNSVSAVAIASVVCRVAAKKVSNEKGINLKEALNIVMEGIAESQILLK